MSLTTEISAIVNAKFPDATYVLSSWFKANRKSYDNVEMTLAKPFIILSNELPKDKEIQPNANLLANSRVLMWFLVKGGEGVYTTDEAMNTDIEALEIIADQIFNNIYQLSNTRLKGTELLSYKITPKFKIFNAVLVGVEAEGRFKENQVRNWCTS